jgi:hypothetical protein
VNLSLDPPQVFWRNHRSFIRPGATASDQRTYKGYAFTDETTELEDGKFRARVRIP